MCSVCLGRRFFVSFAQAPLAESEEIVGTFVSSFAAVVSAVQLRQVSIFVVFVIALVWWSWGLVVQISVAWPIVMNT